MRSDCLYLDFKDRKTGFAARLDVGYERKRNIDDSKALEQGLEQTNGIVIN